jgi:UDP-N-acetylglucosamine diphosphorylase / glucose-1-phosphate thymidylyltransferase / UDP-N-acetylgalactosamine diphosphorylase / glucosamine-1-phosphate N-acetyltransferase / galactosamine-1-phosphate N-acetyltransferase
MDILKPDAFFALDSFEHRSLFEGCAFVWDGLTCISSYLDRELKPNIGDIRCFRKPLPDTLVLWRGRIWSDGFQILGGDPTRGTLKISIDGTETTEASVLYAGSVFWDEDIFFGPGVAVEPGALIKGPTLITANTDVRQGAYVRGKCIIGKGCVVGHTTEMKSSIMLDGAKAGHFAYIGDSILGNSTNLGAGTKLANLKIRGSSVVIRVGDSKIDTGLRKLGAIVGDGVEIGCNTVTNPGTLLAKEAMVFPVSSVSARYYPPKSLVR